MTFSAASMSLVRSIDAPSDVIEQLDPILASVSDRLTHWFTQDDFLAQAAIPFGATAGTEDWTNKALTLRQSLLDNSYALRWEVRSGEELGGAMGAYSTTGTTGEPTIYLNADWLQGASTQQIEAVLLEELGHSFDDVINQGVDSAGDEGAIFSALVRGVELSPQQLAILQAEDDTATLILDGQRVVVEQAAPTIRDSTTVLRTTQEDTPLTLTGITLADLDDEPQTVTLNATNGVLALATTGGLTNLVGNGTSSLSFSGSLTDINAALNGLVYTPNLNYFGSASLTLTTNDGTASSSRTVALAVTAVNDNPMVVPTAVTVNEGGQVTFANLNFGITDVDNIPTQIILKLVSLPTKGYLIHNGAPVVVGSTFPSDQIALLRYVHDGTQTTALGGTSDSFVVSVDDGAGGFVANATIPITITPVNQPPSLGSEATVFEGQTNFLLPFAITDPDQSGPFSIELLSLPTDGTLLVNGFTAVVGQILTTADLANLTYSHNGNDANGGFPPNDGFNVRITDDGSGTGTPAVVDASYTITVLPNNDDPVLVNNTGAVLTGATGRSLTLTSAQLQVSDPDSTSQQLTYTVTALPSRGLLLKNGARLPVGASFTQADIDAGRIVYLFSENPGPGGTTDSFVFTVRDGELRTWPSLREGGIYPNATSPTLLPITFNLTIAATTPPGPGLGGDQGSYPPLADNNPPTGNVDGGAGITALGLTLNEAGSAVIGNTRLQVTDADSSDDQIIYRLMGLPQSGVLRLDGRVLNLYDSFTQADINGGRLRFDHGGNEVFDDSFSFTLSDGNSIVTNNGNPFRFALTVIPINDRPSASVVSNPFVREGESVVIDGTRLRLQDPDGRGEIPLITPNPNFAFINTLTFRVTSLPLHGRLVLDGVDVTLATVISEADLTGGKLVYVHNGSEQFSDAFTVQVNDNTAGLGATNFLSAPQVVNIDIAKVNDDPVFLSATDLRVAEGEKGTIFGFGYAPGAAHLIYNDPDNNTIQRQYRITKNVAHGRLTLNGNRLGVGSVFTQADLDNGRIEYEHDDSENFSDTFEFGVRDGGGAVVPGSFNIVVDPTVNDAPEVTAPTQPQRFDTLSSFVFSTATGNAITIADPDLLSVDAGEVDFIRVTLDLRAGGSTYAASTLTLASTAGLTIIGNNGMPGGLITLAGSLAAVQAALNGLSVQVPTDEDRVLQLVITADDRLDPGNPALLNNGGRDPVGAAAGYNIVSQTIAIYASNVNDPPTITGPAAIALNEDSSVTLGGANAIAIADLDDFGAPMTVTLSIPGATGTLTLPGATGNGTNTVTLTGTKADINAALQSLTYTPLANFNGSLTLTATVNDNGNIGSGGSQTATTTVALTVNPLNDRPTLTVPGLQTIDNASVLTLAAGAIAIDDAQDLLYGAADSFTVTVTARRESNSTPFGELSATAAGGAVIGGQDTDTLTITGTKADINATLNTLTYDPVNSNIDDRIRITVTVDDGNNGAEGTGLVGESTTRSGSFLVNISGVNDPPMLTAPTNALSVNEDAALTLTGVGNIFSFDDPDDFGATNLTATLTVTQGTLSLVSADGTIVSGSGTNTLTLTGSELALNAALDGLIFTPTPNYHGSAQLTVTINDQGNVGTGGAKTDSVIVPITVNPVNDRPVASGSITLTQATEDTIPGNFTLAALVAANNNYSDATDNQTAVGGNTTATGLSHVAIVGSSNYVAGQGSWQVSDGSGGWITIPPTGLSATTALVFPADRTIRFVPAPNFHGTPGSLSVRLADGSTALTISANAGNTYDLSLNGGTTATGAWSLGTIPIAINGVANVNDAPQILNPATPAALTNIAEDNFTAAGATVNTLFASKYSDATDNQSSITGGGNQATPLAGIAIIGNGANAATEGTWQYNTGSGWVAIPTGGLGDGTALVLASTAQLRFVPIPNYNGTPGGLTVRLSDGLGFASGTSVDISGQLGGTQGWSADSTTLTTIVNPVNDAPLLDNSFNLTLNPVNEDAAAPTGAVGVLVSSLTAGISDIDAGAVQGIAVTGIQNGNLWYSLDNGATWQSAGAPTGANSRLLAADGQTRLFFRPSANINGTFDALTIRAWDRTSGTNGSPANTNTNGGTTAFSTATDTIRITINAVNDAPARTVASTALPASPEDTSTPQVRTVTQLFSGTFSDNTDNQTALGGSSSDSFAGVAVVDNGATAAQGQWQYSTDGTTWVNVGTRSLNSALRLAADAQLRFLPEANFNGTPGSLTVRLIDSSGGAVATGGVVNISAGSATGGTTAYSSNANAVTLTTTITAINDAPLATGSAAIAPLNEDPATVAGNLISSLVSANYSDITDTVSGGSSANPLAGIAIVGNATTAAEGTWQYSTDGTTWVNVGTPSSTAALVIAATAQLRFVPTLNYNGPVPVLTAHLIDNSAGAVTTGTTLNLTTGGATGGTAAVSVATIPIGGAVNAVNDAPAMAGTVQATFQEGGTAQLVATGLIITDVDASHFNGGSLTAALASYVAGDTLAIQPVGDGPGEINLVGNIVYYEGTIIGTVAGGNGTALVVTLTTTAATPAAIEALVERITYANASDNPTATGTQPTRSLTLTLSDGGNTGSGGPLTAQISGTLTVEAINDPPVNGVPGPQVFNEDIPLVFSVANGNAITLSDPDAGNQLVEVTLTATQGVLTLATTAGLTLVTGDGTNDSTLVFRGTIAAINTALNGLVLTPNLNYFGPATLTLTTNDLGNTGTGGALNDTDVIALTLNPVNDTPVPVGTLANQSNNDAAAITPVTVTGFFSDPDGDTLTYTATGLPAGLSLHPTTGVISGTIGSSASQGGPTNNGIYAVIVTANDGKGGTTTQTFTWTVSNPAPTATNDVASVTEDGTLIATGNLITGNTGNGVDSDPDGDPLAIVNINGNTTGSVAGTYGNLTWGTNGTYTYTLTNTNPTVQALGAGETLTETFTYTLSDGQGGTNTATLTVTINGTNEAPVAVGTIANQSNNDGAAITPINVTGFFNDPNGDTLTYSASELPAGLTIDPTTGIISGTIDNSASQGGTNGVYAIIITANDGKGGTTTQTFNWTVNNPAPTATNDGASVTKGSALTTTGNLITDDTGAGVDSDPDGDPLAILSINGNLTGTLIATYGTLTWVGDGTYTYTLDPNNAAVQALGVGQTLTDTFTYTLSDGEGGTDTATLTITINGANDPPAPVGTIGSQTNDDGAIVTPIDVKGFFSDPNGDTLAYFATGLPAGLSLDAKTGILSGTINRSASQGGTNGVYAITITANDGKGGTTTQTFNWAVNNPAPIATNNVASVTEDGTLAATGNLITSNTGAGVDSDPDGDPLTISNINGTTNGTVAGSYGSLVWNPNGTYTYSLTNGNPAVQALGIGQTLTETFTYTLSDGEGGTSNATLTVTINGSNDAPVPVGTIANQSNNDGAAIAPINVTGFFNDPDTTDTLTYAATGLPAGLTLDAKTGILSGTINRSASQGGTNGVYEVTITASDGKGGTTTQTFNWTVNNPAPIATNNVASVTEDGTLAATGNLITSNTGAGVDRDPDGDPLAILRINGATGTVAGRYGSLVWNPNGTYTYSLTNGNPAVQALGVGQTLTDTFTYTLSDGEGGTSNATLAVTINGSNDAPIVVAPIATQRHENSAPINLSIAGNFADPDTPDTLTYGVTGLPPGLSLNPATGLIRGTLASNASQGGPNNDGQYSVTITATDNHGALVRHTFQWVVRNLAPIATNNRGTVTEDTVPIKAGNLLTDNDGFGVDRALNGGALTVARLGRGPVIASNPAQAISGSYGTLTWQRTGGYTYTLNNALAAVQRLAPGQTLTDAFAYTISDSQGRTASATLTLTINGTNDAPTLDLNPSQAGTGHTTPYDAGLGPMAIAPASIRILDVDSPRLASATLTLINRLDGSAERLIARALPPGITASAYNPNTGQITLTGLASLGAYQTAIAAVAYQNTALYPTRQHRTIRVVVNDGRANSNVATTLMQWAGNGFSGTEGNDILNGVDPNGSIGGLSNPDVFYGYGGNDIITGGSDTDVIYGGTGNDVISGGGGNDRIYGEAGDDVINGGTGNDYLNGGLGNDVINGGSGNDVLIGGLGNDVLNGGSGNDALIGGPGTDQLIGGQGSDLFIFNAITEGLDTIVDFEILHDRIDLRQIQGLTEGNVRLQQSGANTLLSLAAGGQIAPLATLLNVNANTLAAHHIILPGQV